MSRFLIAGRVSSNFMSVPESVTARLIFLVIVSGSSSRKIEPVSVLVRFGHLFRRVGERHYFGTDRRDVAVGNDERFAEIAIEAFREIARQFKMLFLILADRDEVGLIKQNVRGHQHRIGEQADAGTFGVALALVLELRHSLELAHA